MGSVFKMVRQMLLDYQENPVPLTPLGYFYLDCMIQYHRNYNDWYNNLGSSTEEQQNQRPVPTPAVAAPPLPPTPISRNRIVEQQTEEQATVTQDATVSQEITVTEGVQPARPARRLSRVNRLTARPRRLFQEEISAQSVEQASESRINETETSEEEKTQEQVMETPRRGTKRRNEENDSTPKRSRTGEDSE